MKKTLFAVAGLMMLASCNNDDVLQNDVITDEGRLVTVTTTFPGETPDSRVVLTEENPDTDSRKIKVEWEESGETFSVMTATSEASQTFTQTEGNNFEGTLTDGWSQPYYAFYPATDATSAAEVAYDLSTQKGTLEGMTNYMYAVNTTDGKEYNFKHLTAIVKFTLNLPDNYTPTSLSLVSDRLLAKGTMNLTGENMTYTNELSAHSITVTNPTVSDGKIVLYLNVLPMAASADSENTLHIRTHDGTKGYSGSIATSKEIKAGKFYTATVDVNTHDYDYNSTTGYTVHSAWGMRAWRESMTSNYSKTNCTLNDDIDMSTLPKDVDAVNADAGYSGNWPVLCGTYNAGYKGTFDGQNKCISGLDVVSVQTDNPLAVGFIGKLRGTLKNVIFKGARVASYASGSLHMGVAAGNAGYASSIENVKVIKSEEASQELIFIVLSKKTGSSTNVTIQLGGIVGYANDVIIKNCHNEVDLSVKDDYNNSFDILRWGGIAGRTQDAKSFIIQCTNSGSIMMPSSSSNNSAGGILGENYGYVVGCVNTATNIISAKTTSKLGGAIGWNINSAAKVYGCYTTALGFCKTNSGSLNGCYHSSATTLTGVTTVSDFNADEVVNGINAALAAYNALDGLDDAYKCDKHWEKGTTYPVLVDGAPTAN